MNKELIKHIEIRKEQESIGCNVYRAYWKDTERRVMRANSCLNFPAYFKKTELRFDLVNNPIETN